MSTPVAMLGNRYRLLDTLGQGGMGTVYRAEDRLAGHDVALKQVRPPQLSGTTGADSDSAGLRLALAQEFATLASLRHPHIISVLDYGFDESHQPYFTMEYLAHPQSLLDAATDQPWTVKVSFLMQLLQALTYLHRRGVLHRDLKPSNVLVTSSAARTTSDPSPAAKTATQEAYATAERVKVLDFGLAILHDRREAAEKIAGTLAYMAPEILGGQTASAASDLYAVGVIAYQLLVGRHPFDTSSQRSLMLDILQTPPDLTPLLELDSSRNITADLPDSDATVLDTSVASLEGDTLPIPTQTDLPRQITFEPLPGTPISMSDTLVDIIGRLLAKSPQERYHDAEEVVAALSAATGVPVPAESAAIRESFLQAAQFVGRKSELIRLTEALEHVYEGHGSAWLVGGESGVGKSRLLDELRIQALVRGALVWRGQAVSEGGLPFVLWRDVLRRLVIALPISDVDAGILQPLIPDIEALLNRPIRPAPALNPSDGHQRLLGTITSLFRHLQQPLVLILEDLHWSIESLDVLKRLVPMTRDLPLLIVGTYRDDERPDLPDQLSGMAVMKLERLTEAATTQLVESMLGKAGQQPQLVHLLQQETEGNAFFLVEVVRALAEEAGSLDDITRMTLPQKVLAGGVQQVIQRRLSRVPESMRSLLQLAAITGRQLDPLLLKQLDPDLDLDTWFTIAANAAVLQWHDEHWRFAHDKLREGLLTALDPAESQRLHEQVASAIEAAYPDSTQHYSALARHWGAAANREKELHYAALAGEQAFQDSAFTEARSMLERALQLEKELNPADLRRHLEIQARLTRTVFEMGDYPEVARRYREILDSYTALNDENGIMMGLVELGNVTGYLGEYDEAKGYLQRGLELARARNDEPEIARALTVLGFSARTQGDFDDALHYLEESLALCRKLGNKFQLAAALAMLGTIKKAQQAFGEARTLFEESLAIYYEIGFRPGIAAQLGNLGAALFYLKEYEEAERIDEQCLVVFRELGNQWGISAIINNIADLLIHQHKYDKALGYLKESLQVTTAINALPMVMINLLNFASLYWRMGKKEAALQLMGFIWTHPATEEEYRVTNQAEYDSMKSELPPDVVAQLTQRGQAQTLDAVVAGVLAGA